MNSNRINNVVFEALFRQAVIDNFEDEINSILSDESDNMYTPSLEFKEKMNKLFKADNRKIFISNVSVNIKKIAAVLLIALGFLFNALLFNKEVQATVRKVIIEIYDKFNSIIFKGEQSNIEVKDWELSYVPKGYYFKKIEKLGDFTSVEYEDIHGNKIRFSYGLEKNSRNISVDNNNHIMEITRILNVEAYLVVAQNIKFDNGIIWNMEGYSFKLWGKNSIDELKKMAEFVVKK